MRLLRIIIPFESKHVSFAYFLVREFNAAVQGVVEAAYEELNQWHKST